jgi:hypothetical protein
MAALWTEEKKRKKLDCISKQELGGIEKREEEEEWTGGRDILLSLFILRPKRIWVWMLLSWRAFSSKF